MSKQAVFNPEAFARDLLAGLYDLRLHEKLRHLTVEQLERVVKAVEDTRYESPPSLRNRRLQRGERRNHA